MAIADISALEADPAREFVDRALALRGEALRVPADFVLDDWATIARSAAAIAPLVSVNMIEDEDGEISYVGELVDVEANALVLREIDPNAEWYPRHRRVRVRGDRIYRLRLGLSRCAVAGCRRTGGTAVAARARIRYRSLVRSSVIAGSRASTAFVACDR